MFYAAYATLIPGAVACTAPRVCDYFCRIYAGKQKSFLLNAFIEFKTNNDHFIIL
jgi:hypothetical protein